MTFRNSVEENTNILAFKEKRKNRPDRRIRGERRGAIDPLYSGKIRRMTIERRMRTDSRREL